MNKKSIGIWDVESGILATALLVSACLASPCRGEGAASSGAVPPAFAPFRHLVGAWKGQAVPRANRIRGWGERHVWAWRFRDGVPSGLGIELTGDRTIARAGLSYDAETKTYRLEGTTPEGRPVAFSGPIDAKGRTLTLERATPKGRERLTIRLNANRIRYTMLLDAKEDGAPQFSRVVEVNLGKEGEAFAAGGDAKDLPECVVTGGAATTSVACRGRNYPVCCTGCRDEFTENPEKYLRKLMLRARAAPDGDRPAESPDRPARGRDDDGAFDGLIEEKPATAPK